MNANKKFLNEENKAIEPNSKASEEFSCIDILEGLSRMTYRNFSIVDYPNNQFLYVSDNSSSLCGVSSDIIMDMGCKFYEEYVVSEDLQLMNAAKAAARNFLAQIPMEEKFNYILSYNFRIKHEMHETLSLVNHQYTPLKIAPTGEVLLAVCLTSMSSNRCLGMVEITHKDRNEHWVYDRSNDSWKKTPRIVLKKEEKEVVKLSAQGYSISDMAEYMNKSFDTIKFYRKSLFRKLDADNITEAVSRAVSKRLL